MIYHFNSYRSFLRASLSERILANSSYSLRAFARHLELSPSVLSQVLNGKRNFSFQMSFKVATKLNLTAEYKEYFQLLVQYETEKHPELKLEIQSKIKLIQSKYIKKSDMPIDLNIEIFKFISEWYHIPIIEMTELKNFKFNIHNVAKKIGISYLESKAAIERLVRLNLIQKITEDEFKKTNTDYQFNSPIVNDALNKFHRQMLLKAVDSLTKQNRQERRVYSNTFSINPELIPKASLLVEKFRADLVELFNSSTENTQTYHLGIQMFKLTDV